MYASTKIRLTLILLLTCLSGIAFSQTNAVKLLIKGLPAKQAKAQFPLFKDSLSAAHTLQKEIKSLQLTGYFETKILNTTFKNDTLQAQINLGVLYQGIYLSNGNIANELINDLGLREGFQKNKAITLNTLSKVYNNILGYYENNGYPFAQVWIDSLKSENEQIKAQIFVRPNKKFVIDTLRAVGNVQLNQGFLSSYLGLKKGQNYQEQKIKNIDKRLKDLPFITVPRTSEVVFSGERASLNIFMEKQNANQFDGIIGFLPNSSTGKLQLTGDFKLNLKNALKNGETLDFNYRGLPSQSQELALKIIYPYLFKSPLGINGEFQLFKRDTSFLNINTKLAFDYQFNANQKLSFFVENFNGNQVETTSANPIPNFANISSLFYGLSAAYVHLDDRITPLKGSDLVLQAAVGTRKIGSSSTFNPLDYFESANSQQFKIQGDLKYYLKLGLRSVFLLRNYSAILTGKNLFVNEAFRIGGAKNLRGFDEQSINANSFSIQTFEMRYLIEKNSYLNIFYDQAYIQQNFINQQASDYPAGFGLGITFQTKIGIASLSYALGKQKNIPVDLQKGKIHFGIVSYF